MVEILESDFALLVPNIAYFRSAEYGKAVRPFLDDVVSVDYGNLETMDGRGNRGHFGRTVFGRVFGQGLLEGDIAAVYRVRQFRLQEVALEVYPHKERAEIAYLVVVLHFVDDGAVKHQV